jgi:hypothetical protein
VDKCERDRAACEAEAMRRQWWADRLADAALGVVLALVAAFGCLALYLLARLGKILAELIP